MSKYPWVVARVNICCTLRRSVLCCCHRVITKRGLCMLGYQIRRNLKSIMLWSAPVSCRTFHPNPIHRCRDDDKLWLTLHLRNRLKVQRTREKLQKLNFFKWLDLQKVSITIFQVISRPLTRVMKVAWYQPNIQFEAVFSADNLERSKSDQWFFIKSSFQGSLTPFGSHDQKTNSV
jgi:hypothetical protein